MVDPEDRGMRRRAGMDSSASAAAKARAILEGHPDRRQNRPPRHARRSVSGSPLTKPDGATYSELFKIGPIQQMHIHLIGHVTTRLDIVTSQFEHHRVTVAQSQLATQEARMEKLETQVVAKEDRIRQLERHVVTQEERIQKLEA